MLNDKQVRDPIVQAVPHRIVFTGGPLGGKSTVMRYLEGAYDQKARFMTEVASMLLMNGYPKPGSDVEFSEAWLDYINETILPTQVAMENGHLHAAAEGKKKVVFFDRGMVDPAAYVPDGKKTLRERYGMDIDLVYSRYTMVIHMQSLACADKEEYERLCSTNPARYDTADMAVERDAALVEAWKDHPNWVFIPADTDLETKLQQVLQAISPLLDVEIERKFLVREVPAELLSGVASSRIEQFYLMRDKNAEVRVRSYDDTLFELCIKDTAGRRRLEWETQMPAQVFHTVINDSLPSVLKTRYYLPYGPHTLELDVYDELNTEWDGATSTKLCILECEFPDEKTANAFVLPEWASDALEVTDDPQYKNSALAYTTV
ncbi:MAG: AAA family ATPase [Armatimonadetes bacterium]|nr:AAA family ATPase [Armatimonadota bacterium]